MSGKFPENTDEESIFIVSSAHCYESENNQNEKQVSKRSSEIEQICDQKPNLESLSRPESLKKISPFVRMCAAFLIIGGLSLLVQMVISASQGSTMQLWDIGLLISAIIFGGSGIIGIHLWKGALWPVPWARILFCLQIPIIVSDPVIYQFTSGVGPEILWSHDRWEISFYFGGEFQFFLNSSVPEIFMGINFVGLFCLIGLLKLRVRPAISRLQMLLRSFRFSGRATRNEWWLWITGFLLGLLFFSAICATIQVYIATVPSQDPLPEFTLNFWRSGWMIYWNLTTKHMHLPFLIAILSMVILFWLLLACSVRRLHDLDRSGWYLLIGLLPYLGAAILIIWLGIFKGISNDKKHSSNGGSLKVPGLWNDDPPTSEK